VENNKRMIEIVTDLNSNDIVLLECKSAKLCISPYPGHTKGCPNFNTRNSCPPRAKELSKVFDMTKRIVLVAVRFDLGEHVLRMSEKHPDWSNKQLVCCLYWQMGVVKKLKALAARQADDGMVILTIPEAHGVNITETMKNIGFELEWPPKKYVWKVALIGYSTGIND